MERQEHVRVGSRTERVAANTARPLYHRESDSFVSN